jgi:hypothetical protein
VKLRWISIQTSYPDNYDYWQVFGDDKKVECFLFGEGEFVEIKFDWGGLVEILEVEYLT